MKLVKDFENVIGKKVKTKEGVIGIWKSAWQYEDGDAGVWLNTNLEKPNQVKPFCLTNLKETLDWEVLD